MDVCIVFTETPTMNITPPLHHKCFVCYKILANEAALFLHVQSHRSWIKDQQVLLKCGEISSFIMNLPLFIYEAINMVLNVYPVLLDILIVYRSFKMKLTPLS